MAEDTALLEREVRYFHAAFFRRELPPEIVERYVAANRLCVPADEQSHRRIVAILSRRLDVESIELVLRTRRLDTILTHKIQILFYLVEVRADYYDYFVSRGSQPMQTRLALAASVVSTLWSFAKGTYLIWRYGLV